MKKSSNLEKISGSLPIAAGSTALAAFMGGPVAALLPVLMSSLANERHKERVSSALVDIEDRLSKIENINSSLTDAQFLLINELVISIINTPDDEKVKHLKHAAYQTPLQEVMTMHDAKVLSRALNDLSIGELSFLIECHGKNVVFNNNQNEGFFNIDKFSHDGERAIGLINLGLLSRSASEGTASDEGSYQFTPLAHKIVELITEVDH